MLSLTVSPLRPSLPLRRAFLPLFLGLAMLGGCRRSGTPQISFSKVPVASIGGLNFATIAGSVSHAHPDQRVVLYTKVGSWWVQPDADHSFTSVGPNGDWQRSIHLGTDYAALLVDAGYQIPTNIDVLPAIGNGVVAVKTVPGPGNRAKLVRLKTLRFSGYDWWLVDTDSDRGGTMHPYRPENVTVDGRGFLHLRITRLADRWSCSELILQRSFGYGTYAVTVVIPQPIEPSAVLSLFTWDRSGTDVNHREMDINISRWGNAEGKNVEYILEPYYLSTNVYGLEVKPGLTRFSLHWEPGKASFESRRIEPGAESAYLSHTFTGNVPTPGDETLRMNFCEVMREQAPLRREAEILVQRFQYLP